MPSLRLDGFHIVHFRPAQMIRREQQQAAQGRMVLIARPAQHGDILGGPARTDGKVFLVDDEPSVRRALTRLLRSAGLEVESFPSGDELLAMTAGTGPACVVADLRAHPHAACESASKAFSPCRGRR